MPGFPVSDWTLLEGAVVSMVLIHVGVRIAALLSNTIDAWFEIAVPLAIPANGATVKLTRP